MIKIPPKTCGGSPYALRLSHYAEPFVFQTKQQ